MIVPLLAAALVLLDQLTKELIRRTVVEGTLVPVIPGFFNITLVHNTGAAWGMFSGRGLWLALLACASILLLCIFRKHLFPRGWRGDLVLGLLLGGIIGNMIDRIRSHAVLDFLDFVFFGWHFPAFNVADIAICTGCGLYMLFSFLQPAAPQAGADAP